MATAVPRPVDKKDPLGEGLLARLPLRHYTPPLGQGMTARQHLGMTVGLVVAVGVVLTLLSINLDSPQHACEDEAADPLGRLEVCTTLLEAGETDEDDRARAFAARGNAYYRLHKFEAAIADFGEAIGLDPDKPANWFNQGLAYYGAGRYREAIRDFTEAIEINPDAGRVWLSRAFAHLQAGDARRAVADFDQAILFNPRMASAWNGRGQAQMAAGQRDRAIADFDQAIRLDPRLVQARIGRAAAFAHDGDQARALAEFDGIVAMAPDAADAWRGRGDIHFVMGDLGRAIADYDAAIRLVRDRPDFWQARGDAYRKQGDFARALEQYDEALSLDRDNAPAINALAWLQATSPEVGLRNGIKAVTLAERAVRLDPGSADYRDTLAAAHAESGHFFDAVREQERAVRMMEELVGGPGQPLVEARARLDLYRQGRPYRE